MGVGVFEPWHLVLVLVIILMLFGPGKLPSVGRGIGDAFRELKKATQDDDPAAKEHATTVTTVTTVAAAPAADVACKNCGSTLIPHQKFCANCGSSVVEPVTSSGAGR